MPSLTLLEDTSTKQISSPSRFSLKYVRIFHLDLHIHSQLNDVKFLNKSRISIAFAVNIESSIFFKKMSPFVVEI